MDNGKTPWLMLCLVPVILIGCQSPMSHETNRNASLLRSYQNDQIVQAILSQSTLFSYHFVAGGSELNELGRHDLSVVAEQRRGSPLDLSVRQGDAGDALYQQRLAAVRKVLDEMDVPTTSLNLSDRPAEGGEMGSNEALLRYLQAEARGEDKQIEAPVSRSVGKPAAGSPSSKPRSPSSGGGYPASEGGASQ